MQQNNFYRVSLLHSLVVQCYNKPYCFCVTMSYTGELLVRSNMNLQKVQKENVKYTEETSKH